MIRDWDGIVLDGFLLRVGTYPNGRPGVEAIDRATGECEAKITLNLPDEPLAPGEFFVQRALLPYSRVWGLLIAEGLAQPTGRTVGAGFDPEYAEVWEVLQ
jgi:hypothetical protein